MTTQRVEATLLLVAVEPVTTYLTANVAAGATVLPVDAADEFGDAGSLTVGDSVPMSYTATTVDDLAGDSITVSALDAAASVGDLVTPVDSLGVPITERVAYCSQADDVEPVRAILSHTLHDTLAEGDGDAGQTVLLEQTVSHEGTSDGWRVMELPARTLARDGTQVATGTVGANALTSGASTGDLVGATFEDAGAGKPFAGWEESWWMPGDLASSALSRVEVADPSQVLAGSRSARITMDTAAAGRRMISDRMYPVQGGQQQLSVSVQVAGSRAVSSAQCVIVTLHTSTGDVDPGGLPGTGSTVWTTVVATDSIGTGTVTLANTVTVPAGHKVARVSINAGPSNDGSGWALIVDEFHMSTARPPESINATALQVTGTTVVASLDQVVFNETGLTLRQVLAGYTVNTAAKIVKTYPVSSGTFYQGSTATNMPSYHTTGDFNVGYDPAPFYRAAGLWFPSSTIIADWTGKTIGKIEIVWELLAQGNNTKPTIPSISFSTDATQEPTWQAITGKTVVTTMAGVSSLGTVVEDITSIVPAAWMAPVSGTVYTVLMGDTAQTNMQYTFKFAGPGDANPPYLRITQA